MTTGQTPYYFSLCLNKFITVKPPSQTSTNSHLSPTATFFGGQSTQPLLFEPHYNGHFLLSPRLRRGSTVHEKLLYPLKCSV